MRRIHLLFLVLVSGCLLSFRIYQFQVEAPAIYPVHNLNTGLNYTTIQGGIDANETLDGHTIYVDAGIYDETITVNKSISLKGENSTNTILDAISDVPDPFGTAVVNITASNMEMAGFNLTGWYFRMISASTCSNITIKDNIIQSTGSCISLDHVTNSTIEENMVLGGGLEGNNLVILSSCSGCIIRKNTIRYACYDGIVVGSSPNNLICENLISHNLYGIDFNGYPYTNERNLVFHNNFEGNGHSIGGTFGYSYFNDGFEGNYWSDYTGNDTNQDGIGDTPYANTDFHPLMGAFQGFTVSSPTDGSQSITFISNSTVTDFSADYSVPTNDSVQLIQLFLKFSVTGQNGTTGFCRLQIPKAMMNSSLYIVFVDNKQVNATQLPNSNSTVECLFFTYVHSTHQVLVFIPEFPSYLILPLFIIATLLTIIFCRKKPTRTA